MDVILDEDSVFDRLRHRLYEQGADTFARNGIDIHHLYFLGKGSQGMAFSRGDRTVLKVTHDEREARTAAFLRDNPLKNVVRIHAVYLLRQEEADALLQTIRSEFGPEMPGDAAKRVYAIIQDELQGIPDADAMRRASRFLKKESGIKTSFDLLDPARRSEVEAAAKKALDPTAGTYCAWLITALVELAQAGIKFKDYHAGGGKAKTTGAPLQSNILQDIDGPKLIDIGYANPPEEEPISALS